MYKSGLSGTFYLKKTLDGWICFDMKQTRRYGGYYMWLQPPFSRIKNLIRDGSNRLLFN